MASVSYSFVDVAVLDVVRERFAAGDALVILSEDLAEVIWANGAGAALLGFDDIESAIGADTSLPVTAKRQIAAAPRFPDIGPDQVIAVRLARSVFAPVINLHASALALPDGERAILLARPATGHEGRRATAIVEGFDSNGQFAALVDAEGIVAAASEGFDRLGVSPGTLRNLVSEVREESDRLVKRLINGSMRRLPAAFARLTDDPASHLLIVVDEQNEEPQQQPQAPVPEVLTPETDLPGAPSLSEEPEPIAPSITTDVADELAEPETPNDETIAEDTAVELPANEMPVADTASEETPSEDHSETTEIASSMEDAQAALEAPAEPRESATEAVIAASESLGNDDKSRPSGTVRFAWRTDADGCFTSLSDAFVEAMGSASADIIGRRFRDVSNAFGLDPEGRIAGLLERRDTWSGRTVLWPLAGTELKVPVDLAALPIYGRGRVFEGFHGFGLARMGDAVNDPEKIGLALLPGAPLPEGSTILEEPHIELPDDDIEPAAEARDTTEHGPEDREAGSNKVIRLAEHRAPAREGNLSPNEQTAFREIGDRLRRENALSEEKPEEKFSKDEADEHAAAPFEAEMLTPPTVSEEALPQEAISPDTDDANTSSDIDTEEVSDAENNEPSESLTAVERELGSESTPPEAPEASLPAEEGKEELPLEAVSSEDTPPSAVDDAEDAATEQEAPDDATATGHREAAIEPAIAAEAKSAPVVSARWEAPLRAFLPSAFHGEPLHHAQQDAAGSDTTFLAHLPLPILIHAGDVLHYANQAFFDLTGYGDLNALADAGGIDALFADTYEDEEDRGETDRCLQLQTAGGETLPVKAHLQSVPWNGGKALLLALRRSTESQAPGIAQIASQPEAPGEDIQTAELQANLAEMRAIVDTATDGIAIIDDDGKVRSTNRPAEALFGFDTEEVAGKPFTNLFAIESQRAVQEYLNGLSEHGVASVLNDGLEVIGREAQGRFIPLFMTIGRLPGQRGYCAVLRDITQWKRTAEELTQARAEAERASAQKTDFLARVSHEIRTPLNAIIGFSELMIDEKFGPIGNDRYRDYLQDINRSGNHVLDLVNDLLDISKIEAGEQEMHYEAVPLNDVLGETVAMMQPQANRERVIIRSSFASNLPDVVADPRSVRQIALNLLSNAVRYTQAGGQVIVSTAYANDGSVFMRVRDTGVGMTSAEIDEAMKPFKQINSLKRKRGDGTGLGLPLTRAMVEANRASFSISSVPGEGTLVEVSFPPTRVLAD
ncbi:PAS domain S-box protein [Nitratireductor indicus]|uniref:PAS domain S-box protein n=1 Tax=Nitratireductor indicus TaxID=721133 RepID=UPI0028757A4D|nr:PAS domain S-box protein [Nitratireductor indicus]MDS1138636.1 PAS domain S-box protein [Nitratireductor indicus]